MPPHFVDTSYLRGTSSSSAHSGSDYSASISLSPRDTRKVTRSNTDQWFDTNLSVPKYIIGEHRNTDPANDVTDMANSHSSQVQDPARTSSSSTDKSYRFSFMNDPTQPINKDEMRKIRQHVMYDHLNKKSGHLRPRSKKQRRDSATLGDNTSVPVDTTAEQRALTSDAVITLPSVHSNQSSYVSANVSDHSNGAVEMPTRTSALSALGGSISLLIMRTDFQNVLYRPICSDKKATLYLATPLTEVSFRQDRLEGKINPFNSWPKFSDPTAEVERLKYYCSRRFGCQGLSQYWLPALMGSNHSFYSSICIGAAHDDIMNSELDLDGVNKLAESYQRLVIRDGIIKMIHHCLAREKPHVADETIIAILHILWSELMGYDRQSVIVHQSGLHKVVEMRGGLEKLGLGGLLANITVITMHLIAVLYEQTPDKMYTAHAKRTLTEPPPEDKIYPEGPAYSSPSFPAYSPLICGETRTNDLLTLAKRAAEAFGGSHETSTSSIDVACQTKLVKLYKRIGQFDYEPVHMNTEGGMFEAIRLTTRVYVHALTYRIPISKAAAAIRLMEPVRRGQDSSHVKEGNTDSPAFHVRIKNALKHTRLDELWGPMAGVLFWVAVVACAAANYDDDPETTSLESSIEEKSARRWLAAVMARCSILLSFEHPTEILGTLKRLVSIQQMLSQGQGEEVRDSGVSAKNVRASGKRRRFGPEPPVGLQQATMSDFAWDFMSAAS